MRPLTFTRDELKVGDIVTVFDGSQIYSEVTIDKINENSVECVWSGDGKFYGIMYMSPLGIIPVMLSETLKSITKLMPSKVNLHDGTEVSGSECLVHIMKLYQEKCDQMIKLKSFDELDLPESDKETTECYDCKCKLKCEKFYISAYVSYGEYHNLCTECRRKRVEAVYEAMQGKLKNPEVVVIPDKYKGTVIEKDYQRIAQEIEDRKGCKIDWTLSGPKMNGIDISYQFMYPSIIKTFEPEK